MQTITTDNSDVDEVGHLDKSFLTSLKELIDSSKDYNIICCQLYNFSQNENRVNIMYAEKDLLMVIFSTLIAHTTAMDPRGVLHLCLSIKAVAHVKRMQTFLVSHHNVRDFLICQPKLLFISYEIRRTCCETLIFLTYNDTNQKIFADLPNFTTDICTSILNETCNLRPQLIAILGNLTRGMNSFRVWAVSDNALPRKLVDLLVCFALAPEDHSGQVVPFTSPYAHCSLEVSEFITLLQINALSFMSQLAYIASGAQYLCTSKPELISHLLALTDPGTIST